MKKCITALLVVISEMHIKTTIKCHFTPTIMAVIKKRQRITRVIKKVEKLESANNAGSNIK